MKGADILKSAGVKLVLPADAPEDIKNIVKEMDMEFVTHDNIANANVAPTTTDTTINPILPTTYREEEHAITHVELNDDVFEDVNFSREQLQGGIFSSPYTYQIICAVKKLYQKNSDNLDFVTSPS